MARPIYEKLLRKTPEGYYLVTDTAFPQGSDQIKGRIRAPMKDGTVLLRPIVQSYVMKGRELNKFGTCHRSFGLMNITKNRLKMKIFPNFAYIWAILLN